MTGPAKARTLQRHMANKAAAFERARTILVGLPGVEEGPCYGTPGFRVKRKFLARLKEDGETLVVKCGFDERDFRMHADPDRDARRAPGTPNA